MPLAEYVAVYNVTIQIPVGIGRRDEVDDLIITHEIIRENLSDGEILYTELEEVIDA